MARKETHKNRWLKIGTDDFFEICEEESFLASEGAFRGGEVRDILKKRMRVKKRRPVQ